MTTIRINGQIIECNTGNISIRSANGATCITIDGKQINIGNSVDVHIEGNCGSIDCPGSVNVTGSVNGDINCGGSCDCGDVVGDIQAGGSIEAGSVSGDMNAGGSIRCKR